MFDVPPSEQSKEEWDVDLPIEAKPWNIGLIVGPSGSGKTTMARRLFGDGIRHGFDWDAKKSVLDGFPASMGIKDIVGALSAIGFGSPPNWLRPFGVLSTGEQFRVTIARAIAESEGLVVIDEFTSVVDRQVAKVACHAIQKTVRRKKRQLIAVSCHYDIIDWLQPDWVYQPQTRDFAWRCLQQHPPLDLRLYSIHRSAWKLFKHHHYMSGTLVSNAKCVGGWVNGVCVAFAAWSIFPHPKVKNIMRGTRLVVLPDYQGLGIGGRMDDWIGQHLYAKGYQYRNVVAHPAMVAYYARSPRWKCLRSGVMKLPNTPTARRYRGSTKSLRNNHFGRSIQRHTHTFLYVPPAT